MKAAELAAKLEQGGIFRITPEEEALRNKCVRFAADMEKLTSVATVRFQVTRTQEVACICSMWNDNREIRGEGSDIYTAARKAVDQLDLMAECAKDAARQLKKLKETGGTP